MLSMSYINKLLQDKLRAMCNNVHIDVTPDTGVSICKEGKKILITQQPDNQNFPGQCFLYRKDNYVWVLEYRIDVNELIKEYDIRYYIIDAWLDASGDEFTVKVCNQSDERNGLTFRYVLQGDEYKMVSMNPNGRIEIEGKHFHIGGEF